MITVEFVFVLLCYRNTGDAIEFLESLVKIPQSYKVILVNSFYDDDSNRTFQEIAATYDCDFLSVPNKGYSFGNNSGISYAKENYDFQYLIISNPDITIDIWHWEKLHDDKMRLGIVAPKIKTLRKKNQNPMIPYDNPLSDYFMYQYTKNRRRINFYINVGINKFLRGVYRFFHMFTLGRLNKFFCPHGAFIILSKLALDKINPLFDNQMFLFCEESVVACKAKKAGIPIYYTSSLSVRHKEDGSIGFMQKNTVNEAMVQSFLYYYENYRKK